MTDTPLMPCPFCGGEAKIGKDQHNHMRAVYCPFCVAHIEDLSEQGAIDGWNTRTPTTPNKQPTDTFDYHRVREWALQPDRKRANLAFTDSVNRQVAYLIEDVEGITARNNAPAYSPLESGDSGVLDREKIHDDHTQGVLKVTYPEALKLSGVTDEGDL